MVLNEFYNLTIGSIQFPIYDIFTLDEHGNYHVTIRSLRLILNLLTKDVQKYEIKIADDCFGQLDGTKYETGLLGMMNRKEIDFLFYPFSLDLPNPPGQFSSILLDKSYVITSLPKLTSTQHEQNISSTHASKDLFTRISIIGLIIMCNFIMRLLVKPYEQYKAASRYMFHRSLVRSLFVLSLPGLTCIFSATYSSDATSNPRQKLPETLRDIVTLDYKPFFFEGESQFESFRAGVTLDYRDVYRLACEKKTQVPIKLGEPTFQSLKPGSSTLTSSRFGRTAILASSQVDPSILEAVHYSRPYHRSLQAYLINFDKFQKYFTRMNHIMTIMLQSGISRMLIPRAVEEMVIEAPFGVTSFEIVAAKMKQKTQTINWKFNPISLVKFRPIIIFWSISMVISIFLFIVIILTKTFSFACE